MNDYNLNTKKIRRFMPEEVADITDRPYSVKEIEKILSKCDIRSRVHGINGLNRYANVAFGVTNRRY